MRGNCRDGEEALAQETISPSLASYDSLHFEIGEGRCFVELLIVLTHDGLVGFASDKERSHVGAMSMSVPRPSLEEDNRQSCDSYVIPRSAHKDHIVAQEMSETLTRDLGIPAVIVAGIHIEDAKADEIQEIQAHCRQLVDAVLQAFESGELQQRRETH